MNTTTLNGFSSIEERLHQVPASARRVIQLLKRLQHGTLSVQWPDGQVEQFGQHNEAHPGIHAHLHLRNWKPLTEAIKSGDIGFAESYIAGDWSTNHLADLLQLLIANRRDIEDLIYGHWLGRLVYRMRHLLNRNTKANSAKHPCALRPGQPVLHAVARPQHELLIGLVQWRLQPVHDRSAKRQSASCLANGASESWRPGDGNWLRLGRIGRNGRT